LLMDMMHEVYSFFGRSDRNVTCPVDHSRGIAYVRDALQEVAFTVRQGGGIVITDDVLSEETGEVTVLMKRPEVEDAVKYVVAHYPSKRIAASFPSKQVVRMGARDLNIVLTQYNKVKQKRWDRWNIERFEIHEYMSEAEFADLFASYGFITHAVVGTPEEAWSEWTEDFAVIAGLGQLPEKRITLLAVKQ